jgi:site-specific DNA-adenine methylase
MKYVGSKNRLAKDLVPIIQSYIDDNHITNYWEPFVGGAT